MKLEVFAADRRCRVAFVLPGGRSWGRGLLGAVVGAGFGLSLRLSGQSIYSTPYAVTTLAGSGGVSGYVDGVGAAARFNGPLGVAVDAQGNVIVADTNNAAIRRVSPAGAVSTVVVGPNNTLMRPAGVAIDPAGNYLAVDNGSHQVLRITPGGSVTSVAGSIMPGLGNGTGAAAGFNYPIGIAVDAVGTIYVGDTENHAIRRVTPAGAVTYLAGNRPGGSLDGVGFDARFNKPYGVAVDAAGTVYVADNVNHAIRRVTAAGVVTTFAGLMRSPGETDGIGGAARFNQPSGVAVDAAGNVYVAENGGNRIRRITPAGAVTTLAGASDGVGGNVDGIGSASRLNKPFAIAVDAGGTLYFVEDIGHTVRRATPPPLPPAIVTQPISQTVAVGAAATFTVAVTGSGPVTYQWRKAGAAIAGATGARLVLTNVQAGDAAVYSVVVTNSIGSVTSSGVTLNLASDNPGRLINLSIRTNAGTGAQTLIVGFVVGGAGTSGTKPLLIRGVGPALGGFGVPGFLVDPTLSVFAGAAVAAANDNWSGDAAVTTVGTQVGAFALGAPTSRDAALYSPALAARDYTAQITGVGGTTGIVLAEIYDATPVASYTAATPRLANVSARTQVGTGADILIAGFVIGGATPKTLIIRAIGPTLTGFGVGGALADPRLDVFTSGQALVQANDNWTGDAATVSLATSVGAFPLAAGTRDAVLLLTLAPGGYTAQVAGVANGTGVALVEIYDVP